MSWLTAEEDAADAVQDAGTDADDKDSWVVTSSPAGKPG